MSVLGKNEQQQQQQPGDEPPLSLEILSREDGKETKINQGLWVTQGLEGIGPGTERNEWTHRTWSGLPQVSFQHF